MSLTTKYAVPCQIKPGFSSLALEEAKAKTRKKNTIFVSFRWDSSVSTVARTAGTATVGVKHVIFSLFLFLSWEV